MSKAELMREIRSLPFAERVELLEELWRDAESELLDWQKELLDQRLRDAEADPAGWVSWDEAKQRLERQLSGTNEGPSPFRSRWNSDAPS